MQNTLIQPKPLDQIKLEAQWKRQVGDEFSKPYMQNLRQFLNQEKASGKIIYPKGEDMFQAFHLTPFEQVKVVIIGQDPYHGEGQAHGLCFSVRPGVPIPPSLVNIYKERQSDLALPAPSHGCLKSWAEQGVLLLNAVLSVEKDKAASHQNRGWEIFTNAVVTALNQKREHLVFILWGSYAQAKGAHIDRNKHLVLSSPHPSPLSSYRGFFGSKPFSKANDYLKQEGIEPLSWAL